MIRRILFWAAVALAVFGAAYWLKEYLASDEQRVRSAVNGLISDLETNMVPLSIMGIRGRLSERYEHRGERVGMNINRELALAYVYGLKQNLGLVDFKVDVREMKVTITGKTARVELTGRVTAASKGSPDKREEVLTEPGMNRAIIDLVKEDNGWKVTGSERVRYELTAP